MKNLFDEEDIEVNAYTRAGYDDTILSITIDGHATIYVPKNLLYKAIRKAMRNKKEIII